MEQEVANAVFLAGANKAIVDYVVAPVKRKFEGHDFWYLKYVALGTGAVIGWFSGLNVFEGLFQVPDVGRVLTAILIGGGSSLIHEVFEKAKEAVS